MKNPVDIKKFDLECSCGCGSLRVEYFDDDDEDNNMLFLSYNIPAFYAYQNNSWDRFKKAFEIIWTILRGKEYILYEVTMDTKSEVEKFKKFVSDIPTSRLIYEE